MKKPWIVPLVILGVLLVAWPLRWEKSPWLEVNPISSLPNWQHRQYQQVLRDRWTGTYWIRVLEPWGIPTPSFRGRVHVEPVGPYSNNTQVLLLVCTTVIWGVLVFASAAWIWRSYRKGQRQRKQQSEEDLQTTRS
ncbi:MAG: Uncharacterized protein XD63_1121 [Thermoanaerobacterales bacterium 50_218]|nr:MAG: Uncharacterized protein XD63_1121 [Thermoanaerobacterales bacterium 50_218]HAA90150.1 hypothetical protein [Peptococcaceae bacterium]